MTSSWNFLKYNPQHNDIKKFLEYVPNLVPINLFSPNSLSLK
jgi:hypothetical protein